MQKGYGNLCRTSFGLKRQIKQDMIQIDKQLIQQLLDQAVVNPRLRQSYDLRNNEDDGSQRLLYALMPGTKVALHRHPNSNETSSACAERWWKYCMRRILSLLISPWAWMRKMYPIANDSRNQHATCWIFQ